MISLPPEELITPDRWAVLRIVDTYKILSGFSGSYLDPDYWRLNSGIMSVVEEPDAYLVTSHSGSSYRLYHSREGFNRVSAWYYESLKSKFPDDVSTVNMEQAQEAINAG